jgi:hypothetical protein
MLSRPLVVLFAAGAMIAAVACTSTTSSTNSSSSSSSSGGSSGGSSSGASSSGGSSSGGSSGSSTASPVSGTLGGNSFTIKSGIANVGSVDNKLDLVFASYSDLCTKLTAEKIPAGATIVQLYNLAGKAPGEFTASADTKYATLLPACPSGSSVNDYVAGASRATTTKVNIDTLTDTKVTGEVHITFEDGSQVDGSFDVPICAVVEAENATCE